MLLVLFACRDHSAGSRQPVTVHLGEDSCSTCGMIISDEHYGAQQVQEKNPAALFDDLGCLLKESSSERTNIFVRSFENGDWIPAENAFAVQSNQIHSPMGYGISTFETEKEALAHAAKFPNATVQRVTVLLKRH